MYGCISLINLNSNRLEKESTAISNEKEEYKNDMGAFKIQKKSKKKCCTHCVIGCHKNGKSSRLGLGHLFTEKKCSLQRISNGSSGMVKGTTQIEQPIIVCYVSGFKKWNQIKRFTGAKTQQQRTNERNNIGHKPNSPFERQAFNNGGFIVKISMIRNRNRSNLSVGLITIETGTLKNCCRKF